MKVSKSAKIRNQYNQVPYLTKDTNGKLTNSKSNWNVQQLPSIRLSSILRSVRSNIHKGPDMKKYQHYIDVRGEELPTPHSTMTVVATSY